MKDSLRLPLTALLCVVGAACGSTTDDDDKSSIARDGGAAPRDGGPSCTLDAPRVVSVRAGGIVEIDAKETGGSTVEVTFDDDFVVLDGNAPFRARAPYDGAPARTATVKAACGSEATVSIAVIALVFEPMPTWEENTGGPDTREHPMMWIDPMNPDRLLLYGGLSFDPQQYTVVADLWGYDLTADSWTSIPSTDAPPMASGRLAVDPASGLAYYDGGGDQANAQPFSLSALDLSGAVATWRPQTPTGAPSSGSILHGFIYDAPRARYLSIAGIRDGRLINGVWSYDPIANTYVEITVAGTPPSPRYGFFVAHDLENERVVIFSGAQAGSRANPVNPAQDTWALELAEDPPRWVKLFDADLSPPGRRNGCAAVDEAGHRFFVWGGTPDGRTTQPGLFALDLTRGAERWTRVDPEGPAVVRSSCAAVYDPARQRILFGFGNNTNSIYADFNALPL